MASPEGKGSEGWGGQRGEDQGLCRGFGVPGAMITAAVAFLSRIDWTTGEEWWQMLGHLGVSPDEQGPLLRCEHRFIAGTARILKKTDKILTAEAREA